MSDDVDVRDAGPDEVADVAALMDEAYAEHASQFPERMWATYQRDIRAVRDRLDVADLLVAEVDGRLAGAVTLYPCDGRDADWPVGTASLRLLAVRPSSRGHGVGAALLHECIARSRDRGCAFLGLHTAPFMRAGVRLYERHGFRRDPARDFDPHVRYDDAATAEAGGTGRILGLAYVKPLAG